MFVVTINPSQLRKMERALKGIHNGVPKALAPAINRTLDRGRTVVKQEIRKNYVIKAKDIPITMHRASTDHLKGEVEVRSGMLPLNRFSVKPSRVQRGRTRRPLFVQVRVGGGGILPHAFVATTGSYTGPFERVGNSRLPIRKLMGISAAIMASQPNVGPVVQREMDATLEKRIDYEIKRALDREAK